MNKPDTATTMDKTNEHRPGYKWTKLGWVPEEWEVKQLQNIVKKPIVYGIVQAGPHVPDGVPYIKSTDISGKKIEVESLQRTSLEIARKYKRSEVFPGDIIFSLRGNIGECQIVPPELSNANLTQGTARISVLKDFDAKFCSYAISSLPVIRKILSVSKGSTFREISLADLRKVRLLLPPLPEQKNIAAILSTWDAALQALQELIAAKERQQKGLMQRLLTGAVRFGEFVEPWETYRFGDLFQRVTRKNAEDNQNVLTISAQYGLINQRDFFNKDVSGKDLTNYYLLKRGEFAYNKSYSSGYPLGAIKRLDKYDKGVVSTLYICFRLKSKGHDSDFLVHFFEGGRMNHEIFKIAQEGARNHGLLNISVHDFFEMHIQLPGVEEQKKIAEVLNKFSDEVNALYEKLDTLKAQKKGLMQRLLTGEVRTV